MMRTVASKADATALLLIAWKVLAHLCKFVILGSLRLTLEVAQTVAAVARGQL